MPTIPADPASLTPAWFSEILGADVRGCRVEQIGVGVGLLGRLFRVHLDGSPDVPATVVVKMPTLDVVARKTLCETGDLYRREIGFYREIGPADPLPSARPFYARFDDATHDFVLVLEDLGRLRSVDQVRGCSAADAATVIDAIARHHAHWWDSPRLEALTWLTPLAAPPLSDVVRLNYRDSWPKCRELLGGRLSPAMVDFGDRFFDSIPWLLSRLGRPPHTFLHGDLRLDQMFFGVTPDDPPVTVLDWQLTCTGRGAYDVGYFLSQSLTPDTRRSCEDGLLDRYAARLTEHGIDYPREELIRDYRLATAWCFVHPVLAAGRIDIANERQLRLLQTIFDGAATAIEDHDAFALRPD